MNGDSVPKEDFAKLHPAVRFLTDAAALVAAWLAVVVGGVIVSAFLPFHTEVSSMVLPATLWGVCAIRVAVLVRRRRSPGGAEGPAGLAYGPPAAVAVGTVAVLLWMQWSPAAALLRADTRDLRSTVVLSHPSQAIPKGKSALWCASFQAAWDALRRDVAKGSVSLGPPVPAEVVAALNADAAADCRLPDDAVVARVGVEGQGFADGIRRDIAAKFGSEALKPDLPALSPDSLVFFGALQRDLAFEHSFEAYDGRLAFAGGPRRVRAFGMNEESTNPKKREILGQVRYAPVHHDPQAGFALEFAFKGGSDRMVVARMDREATLEGTWKKAEAVLAEDDEGSLRGQILAIPKMNFEIRHDFPEFLGARLQGKWPITLMRQVTRFRLDERGASLRSYAVGAATQGYHRRVVVDQPFLLALARTGAAKPYLLLWIEDDEVLDRE